MFKKYLGLLLVMIMSIACYAQSKPVTLVAKGPDGNLHELLVDGSGNLYVQGSPAIGQTVPGYIQPVALQAFGPDGQLHYLNLDSSGNLKTTGGGSGGSTVWGSITGTLSSQTDLQTALNALVPKTTTVNGHALSGNIAVTTTDIGAVPTTRTVNGHALSSDVTVSASDLTTGTLPHAQLPTLLSGDIPNNAANTSGTAATATALASAGTNCGNTGTAFAYGTDASGNALCAAISAQPSQQWIAPQAVAGCGVEYTGGLSYTIGACRYTINGVNYSSVQQNITLPTADPTNPEIDVIYLDSSQTVQVLQGTPSATPVSPVVDPSTELQLTFANVPAGGTAPSNTTLVNIYSEGTEWTGATGGTNSSRVNLTSTNNPYAGTHDTEFGNGGTVTTTTYAQWTKPSAGTSDMANYNSLNFYIRNKAAWPTTRSLTIQWYNGTTAKGTALVLSNGAYGFNATTNTTAYQQINIPTSAFGINGVPVTSLRLTVSGSGTALTGFYIDQVTLQGGSGGVTLPSTLVNLKGVYSTSATYSPNDLVVTANGGPAYVALVTNTNSPLSTTNTWLQLSQNLGTYINDTITCSGTSCALNHTPKTFVTLARNGILQRTSDFTQSSTTVTLTVPAVSGDTFLAEYFY